ncbi:PQQ-dependent sugar dehydrogenase [Psychrobacter sp. JCM 18903]|uniref:PQQ-dependent sugar dehydrogenase n=1 Tax=Psychrobacter sp. JCM 18903 TaxID=1298610 RepID=UPI0004B1FC14|nr:PQQ-dependent sugar dehydrogenase [Psychrobacter sp. JCM 18903]
MTIISMQHLSTPLMLPIMISALLFSAPACSNQTAVNTHEDLTDYKEGQASASESLASTEKPAFITKKIATFDEPWAMTALPAVNNEPPKLLVTQKTGELFIVETATGAKTTISGIPKVAYGGQGGLGDIVLAPDFATANHVYMSYVEAGNDTDNNKFGAKVIKATLIGLDTAKPRLQDLTPIWEQIPKVKGQGHYSHRLLFSPDGKYLYISQASAKKKHQHRI